MKNKNLHISTPSYQSEFVKIDSSLMLLKREHYYPLGYEAIDTYGDFSILAFADLKEKFLILKSYDSSIELSGPVVIFIPKYTLAHWKMLTNHLKWEAYITKKHDRIQSDQITLFENEVNKPKSLIDFFEIINYGKIKYQIPKNVINGPHKLANDIKDYLDENYSEKMDIKDISSRFNLTNSQVTKIFQKTFTLTPVEYRTKIRVFNSMFTLLTDVKDLSVIDIAFQTGFSDLSRFNKQFKKITQTTPSKFKFK
jgi:AraC-like DNA-binding protein